MKKLILVIILFEINCWGDEFTSDLLPDRASFLDIGSATLPWQTTYADTFTDGIFIVTGGVITGATWNGVPIDISDFTNLTVISPIILTDDTLSIDTIDISDDTNLTVTSPITLTDDSVGIVNQGTSTTVLHGNASGNATFSIVDISDDTNLSVDTVHLKLTDDELSLSDNEKTLAHTKQGSFLEQINFTVSEAGGTVTGSLEKEGGGDLIQFWSDDFDVLDCTAPLCTVDLTPRVGTDNEPAKAFVYILQSAKTTLVAATSWPAASLEHIRIATVVLQSAATTGTEGVLGNRNWNDEAFGITNPRGHALHTGERLRFEHALHESGVVLSVTGSTTSTITIDTTAGEVYQLHLQVFPAIDQAGAGNVHLVNLSGNEYFASDNLVTDITTLADGATALGNNKFFNLVIWGVQNRTGEDSHLMCNLPIGQYGKESDATIDAEKFSVFTIPSIFRGTGFLIAELTFQFISGPTWTLIQNKDLLGQTPILVPGGGTTNNITTFVDSAFEVFDNVDDTKRMRFQVASVGTGQTREITMADNDINFETGLGVENGGTGATNLDAFILADGSNPLTADWDAGSNIITASGFVADTTALFSTGDLRIGLDINPATQNPGFRLSRPSGSQVAMTMHVGTGASSFIFDSADAFQIRSNPLATLLSATPQSGSTTHWTITSSGVNNTGTLLVGGALTVDAAFLVDNANTATFDGISTFNANAIFNNNVTLNSTTDIADNIPLTFGAAPDISMKWDTATSKFIIADAQDVGATLVFNDFGMIEFGIPTGFNFDFNNFRIQHIDNFLTEYSVTATIAAAGSTQGTATAIDSEINEVASGTGGSADGVKLPTATAGLELVVINNSGITIEVFPNTSDAIDGQAINTSVQQADDTTRVYRAYDDTNWKASDVAGAGSGDVTAAANLGDNLLIRGDGATKGVQNSGITVDDSDNISGVTSINFGDESLATYDEGTWTPVIGGSTSESGQAYNLQQGLYTRIGRMVTATFSVFLSTKGTIVGVLEIQGLPFSAKSSDGDAAAVFSQARDVDLTAGHVLLGSLGAGGSGVRLYEMDWPTASDTATTIDTTFITDDTYFIGSVTYFTD